MHVQTLVLWGTLELALGGFVWSRYRTRYSPLPSLYRMKHQTAHTVRLGF